MTGVELRLGDFVEVLSDIPEGSVRAIVTDPPYPRDDLELWSDLSKFAARVLDPDHGVLMALSGKIFLPEVMRRLGERLEYRWLVAQLQPGPQSRIWQHRIMQRWKPWTIYQRPGAKIDPVVAWLFDTVTSTGQEKDLYEWQQSPDPAIDLIRQLVPEGELICDPFLGVGTYGVAAVRTGHPFVGAEIDPDRFKTSSVRIADAAHQPQLPGFRTKYDRDPADQQDLAI